MEGRVVLITGGSRGLGLALAEECARQGAYLAICARQPEPLERARQKLAEMGAEVLALPCDVGEQEQVERLVAQVLAHFGRIDMLINNAGVIVVGPRKTMTTQDYAEAMKSMFWGTLYPTLAVLPFMLTQKSGHIVMITSIGGKVSIPHLLPYSSAKFAALGFSEGLHAELASEGIQVTSIVPGLMRTGSHVNALVKGQRQKEYDWFGFLATFPLSSTSAAHAARRIVQAACQGRAELIITPQAKFLALLHGLWPEFTIHLLSLMDRFLPTASSRDVQSQTGLASRSRVGSWLTQPGEPAAHTYNQYAPQDD
ncbi:MAG TPA: SDR family NAD(P)-dependent oxidoreductase [Ktedonobacteraceae bacterium]